MRVFPWSQYQVVAKHSDSAVVRLASHKGVPCKFISFVCFRHASTALHKSISHPKVGSIQQRDIVSDEFVSHRSGDTITDDSDDHESAIHIKSNLKNTYSCSGAVLSNDNIDGALGDGIQEQFFSCSEGKRVQWTDASGKELVQIREFEPSLIPYNFTGVVKVELSQLTDDLILWHVVSEPDEDCEHKNAQRCACVIM
ncbi:hypothetical protein FRX31_033634 [Thalictrum thalictroides]|uniref:Uncharacterized protein n=1 Tax=Thalictrum thalictroides TaxID=46969 RepID=A0A7J6UX66_THATH|nr:hypothetical protein FRX31_033634 [Thalictrum thalictroides]